MIILIGNNYKGILKFTLKQISLLFRGIETQFYKWQYLNDNR